MNKFFGLSFFAIITSLSLFQMSVSSCTKEKIVNKTDTVTVTRQDTTLSDQMLTAHRWKIYEERGVSGNNFVIYYLRGGSNNTFNLDGERVKFNANGTGIHTAHGGGTTNYTWAFSNPEHTKLTWTVVNTPGTYTITWENIRYKNGLIYLDQYYRDANTGSNSHSQQIRMPE